MKGRIYRVWLNIVEIDEKQNYKKIGNPYEIGSYTSLEVADRQIQRLIEIGLNNLSDGLKIDCHDGNAYVKATCKCGRLLSPGLCKVCDNDE